MDGTNGMATIRELIQGPHGGRNVTLGGILMAMLGCIGFSIALVVTPAGSKSAPVGVALLGLLALIALLGGIVTMLAGGVIGFLRNQKTRNQAPSHISATPMLESMSPVSPTSSSVETPCPPASAPELESIKIAMPDPLPLESPQVHPVLQIPTPQPLPAVFHPAVTSPGLPIEQRRDILQREINRYLKQGYRVINQTDTTAQLVRPKVFSCLWFLIWALLLIGWIFYLAWYWSKRDSQLYLEVDLNGKVKITKR